MSTELDYDTLKREFKWKIPEYYNFAWDTVDKWAEDKTKLALITVYHDGRRSKKMTFWEVVPPCVRELVDQRVTVRPKAKLPVNPPNSTFGR